MRSAGPNTLVGLATVAEGVSRSDLVKRLVPAYVDLLKQLKVRFLERQRLRLNNLLHFCFVQDGTRTASRASQMCATLLVNPANHHHGVRPVRHLVVLA